MVFNFGLNTLKGLAGGKSKKSKSLSTPKDPYSIKGYNKGKLENFTPEQNNLYQQLFSHVSPDSFTSKLSRGDQGTFDQLEAPSLRQFNELQGNLSSRFSGMGTGGRLSSGFQNASNQAASNFAQDLQSKRSALMQQATSELMNMGTSLLGQRPYENILTKKEHKPKWWQSAIGAAAPVATGLAGGYLTGWNPKGIQAGANIGNEFSQGFLGNNNNS